MTAMSEDAGSYRVEHVSKFEPWLLRNLCEPVVKVIPAWISPNMITMVNACVIVLMFALCTISPRLAPLDRLLALFGAAVAMFSSMILDSVDGMHARRTNQTSKLGEFLDHWLDTVHVPLVSNQPQYNMIWRVIEEEVVPASRELGIGQIVWSPIAQGVLTGK